VRTNGIVRVIVIESSQLKGVKPKMKGQILKIGVYWLEAFKQKDMLKVRWKTRAICTYVRNM
jgi:hypothetical protein